ncbi:hypothetical protein J1C56_01945 [Aminobacter anthyllidis]|uniref:Uncharacterized protein n=1 Tax=Aminobacter anthyllidis TaxID=1035067 RepID=A0A9X1A781_9HYPH|nr:hypothetical protein [Aminobacter anthyllidis]MBT1154346.1 hypothetical protein [Aminobacter anthyllidis]
MTDLIAKDAFDRLPEQYRKRAREIAARVRDIDAVLKPCEPAKIGEAVVRMFRQFRDQPGVDHADMAAEYRTACFDLPEWAVSEAANDFLAGRVENHTGQFMPTCAEFARRARHILTPILAERSALRVEAGKLVERAEDDRRRHLIELERHDPNVRDRVAALAESAAAGGLKRGALTHTGLSAEKQSRLDALKRPRSFESKITTTRIGKGEARNAR